METPTRFDLKAAIQSWREELATKSSLTSEERRELEGHLHDSVAELRRCGLNERESFWLACRRLGHPQQLAEEFAKEDPGKLWRERFFWLAIGICAMRLWTGLPVYFLDRIRFGFIHLFASNFFLPDWVVFYLPFRPQEVVPFILREGIVASLFRFAPLVCLIAFFASGRMERVVSALRLFFGTRRRFLLTAAVSLGIYYVWAVLAAFQMAGRMPAGPATPSLAFLIQMAVANALVSALLVGLTSWLMPERPRVQQA